MRRLSLPWVRLVRGGTGLGSLASIVAVTTAGIIVTGSCQAGLQRASLRDAVEALRPADRTVSVSFDGAEADLPRAEQRARQSLADLGATGAVSTAVASRTLWDGARTSIQLAAVGDMPSSLDLLDGRLPASCTRALCEVLQVGTDAPRAAAFGMVIVGHAAVSDGSPLSQLLDDHVTALVSASPEYVRGIPEVKAVGYSTVWAAPLSQDTISALSLTWLDAVQRRAGDLTLTDGRLVLRVPDSEIRRAVQESGAAATRLAGLGLGLALITLGATWRTVSLRRRDVQAVGALAAQYGRDDFGTAGAWTTMLAVLLGWALGCASALAVIAATAIPMPATPSWSAAAVSAAACAALGIACLSTRLRITTPAAAVCTSITAVSFPLTASVVAVPASGIAAGLLAVAATRVTTVGWRASMARVHAANCATPLAAAAVIAAFAGGALAAALTQAVTLSANARDQAVFASPLATRITALARSPLDGSTVADFTAAAGGAAYPVLRVPATVRAGSLQAATIQVLGVPSEAWASMPDERRQTGVSNAALAALGTSANAGIGQPLRAGAPIEIEASGLDSHSDLLVWVYGGQGRAQAQTCIWVGDTPCRIALPEHWVNPSLIGFTVQEQPNARARREHAAGEGSHAVAAPTGAISVTTVRSGGVDVALPQSAMRIPYDLTNGPVYAPTVTAPSNVPVFADSATATSSPAVLGLEPRVDIAVAPVGALRRLPTATDRFVVADFASLAAALAAVDPSLLAASEIWLTNDLPAGSPLAAGTATSRQDDVARALDGSAARRWTWAATSLTAAAMALVALLAAMSLARTMARTLPFRPWALLGTHRRDYLGAATAVVARQVLLVTVGAVVVAAAVANVIVRAGRVDIVGRIPSPPIALTWVWPELAALAVLGWLALTTAFTSRLVATSVRESP